VLPFIYHERKKKTFLIKKSLDHLLELVIVLMQKCLLDQMTIFKQLVHLSIFDLGCIKLYKSQMMYQFLNILTIHVNL